MDRTKKFMLIVSISVFCIFAGFIVYNWVRFEALDAGQIFFTFIALSFIFNILTWGNHEGAGKKDEMDFHIMAQSARIGYFVLMVLASLILFISEGTGNFNQITNYPLLILVGLTFVILPITEFIYAKKFK
ncbi:hypothetical protein [Oceanobacillus profundus]|uniref:hypothetical protein n=1 Tax=Oceanobacillus TaxID=182709 RepID=UPI0026E1C441|nr:hypothetical protein [Oceanobacillus profundus]MDO6449862.1 hypothetical protein [Oceanobacillus profundus]